MSGDLVVWTKHFSTFITFTQTPMGTGGLISGGGGGGYVAPVVTAPVSTPAPTGQVLGASTGPVVIAGCDNRTTGFSITTGQSCVGNSGTGTSSRRRKI